MAPIVGPKTPHRKETTAEEVMQNIKVFVRCRPLKSTEKKDVIQVLAERKEIKLNESKNSNERYKTQTFTFDNTFGAETPQIQVYRSVVEPLIEQVVMGYNCTVFAYGQTGTGKTYTMEGERSQGDQICGWEEDPTAGIIPRAVHQLFETLQTESAEHTVRVSFLELYNEDIYDLLSSLEDTTKLKIYEDNTRKGSIIVGGLEEITVQSKAEIYSILKKGSAKRQTAATLLNACSSRSHTIFSVTVHIKENAIDGEDLVKIGKLNLVDLAGSENIGRSGAMDKTASEAGNINKSLLTLGRVITSLVDRTPHIPYRESKLTRLLQESLGGRTKTSIIATISPNIEDADDTRSTLEYAQRAKKITNKPEINQRLSKKTLLREYTAEIERLRRDLAASREKNGVYVDEDNFNQMEEQIKANALEIEEKTSQIQVLSEEMFRIQSLFEETKEELEITAKDLDKTSKKLTETRNNLFETRTDRDEQKHLVEKHLSTEKVLSTQAKELLSVAEVTTSHIDKLHQKVDRQKNVQTINLSNTEEFQVKFLEDMNHLGELVSIATTSYKDTIDEMQDSIKTNITSVEGIVANTQNKVLSLSETINGFQSKFSTIFTKDRIFLEQSLTLKENCTQIESNLVKDFSDFLSSVEGTQKAIFEDIEKMNQIVAQQRVDVEEVVMKQNSHMKRVSKMTINSFGAIKKELKSVFETQNEEMSALMTQIETKGKENSEVYQTIDSEMDDFETGFEELMKSQLQKLNEIRVQRIKARVLSQKSNTEVLDTIKEKTTSRMNNLTEFTSRVDALSDEIRCEEKTGLKNIERVDELNTEKTQQLMNQLNQINSKNTSLPNDTKELIESRKQILMKQTSDTNKLIDDSIKLSDKQLTAKQTTLKSMEESFNSGLDEQKSLVSEIAKNVNQIKDCVDEKTQEINRTSETMEKSQRRQIEARTKSFEAFVKNDLIEDTPTGTTPQKTTYPYPRDLVETSPHQRILERFRLVNACNTPLPETDEQDSEILSSAASSSSSLRSLCSNDENVKPLTDNQKRKKVGLNSKLKSKKNTESDQTFSVPKNTTLRITTPKVLAPNLNN